MNRVQLIGRLTRDPETRQTTTGQAVVNFSIAIDRQMKETKTTDYPKIKAFGPAAEYLGKYLAKGRLVGVEGRLQTGSYEKNGIKIDTCEVVADRVEFLDRPKETADDYGI